MSPPWTTRPITQDCPPCSKSPRDQATPSSGVPARRFLSSNGLLAGENDAKIEVVADWDQNRELTSDGPLEMLRIGNWGEDKDFDPDPDKKSLGLSGYDADNNLLAGTEPTKKGAGTITATIGTLTAAGGEDDGQTQITLKETGADSGIFVSASQLLTAPDLPGIPKPKTDDGVPVHDGFAAAGAAGIADDQPGDRTHKATIDGSVRVVYGDAEKSLPILKTAADATVQTNERKKVEVRVRVFNEPDGVEISGDGERNTVLGPKADARQYVEDELARANITWTQAGIRIVLKELLFVDAPNDAAGANVLADEKFNLPTEYTTVLDAYRAGATEDVLKVFYAGPLFLILPGQDVETVLGLSLNPASSLARRNNMGDKTFIFMSSDMRDPHNPDEIVSRPAPHDAGTFAHELGHALSNLPDVDVPPHVFFPHTHNYSDREPTHDRRLTHVIEDVIKKVKRPSAAEDPANVLKQGNRLLKDL